MTLFTEPAVDNTNELSVLVVALVANECRNEQTLEPSYPLQDRYDPNPCEGETLFETLSDIDEAEVDPASIETKATS